MKLLMILILFVPIIAFTQVEKPKWDYPVKPGSEEWLKIADFEKRLTLLDIPESILQKISTEELVNGCLSYPEFGLIYTRNDFQSGYDYIRSMFNGFRELETRSDAGKVLMKIYAGYKPDGFDLSSSDLEIGRFVFKFNYIELLLAQPGIQNNLGKGDLNELMTMCSQKYKEKKALQKYYGGIGLETTALIIARQQDKKLVNLKMKHGDQKFNAFIKNLSLEDISFMDEIVSENNKILSDGL
jgi:hypothetical protein